MSAELTTTVITVDPDWVDYNGHMNLAYYVLAFDKATDNFYDQLGIGLDYRAQEDSSMFTLGINVDYLREVFQGDELRITTQLLELDKKRLRYIHQMYQGDESAPVALNECLAIHVNMTSRKSEPFPAATQSRIDKAMALQIQLPQPASAGRVLGKKL
ncbi:MAG: thioesterase family protein [Gammaproteobacteria bacterium]|nr:thioesterase family protein [Gammaproteobacteria bacterium]MBQ0840370.1 thioesterase family protein [Gammaproteobacteria bacterium]